MTIDENPSRCPLRLELSTSRPYFTSTSVPRPYAPHLYIVDREGGLQGEPVAVELQHGVSLASQRVQTGDSGAAERQRCREAEKQKLKPGEGAAQKTGQSS